jgi:hypothetical protein
VKRAVEILSPDWERLRRAHPETDRDQLTRDMVLRGRRQVASDPEESIRTDAPAEQRLAWLRRWTPRKAASIATLGFDLVKSRDRLSKAARFEQHVSQRYLELNREVIPRLKDRANELRAEIHRLEDELRARGLDPGTILPEVPPRIEVDDYKPVEFESQETKQRTIDFFRRIGGDR